MCVECSDFFHTYQEFSFDALLSLFRVKFIVYELTCVISEHDEGRIKSFCLAGLIVVCKFTLFYEHGEGREGLKGFQYFSLQTLVLSDDIFGADH